MELKDRSYMMLVIAHILIGIAIYVVPGASALYGYGIFMAGIYIVIKNQNRNHEVLLVAGYMVGAEVILRMTNGIPLYEFTKYGIVVLVLIGTYYNGISKNGVPYWIFLLLLIPAVVVAAVSYNQAGDLRKIISFNISGPFCLGVCSLYTYTRRISFDKINDVLLCTGLPIIASTVYLILYTPSIREVITGTGSSNETSGGFGPNQVATVLGLGTFIFVNRLMFKSRSVLTVVINLIIILNITFRGLVTFSRGGMMTAFVMIIVLFLFTYVKVNRRSRGKMNYLLLFIFTAMTVTWIYSSNETSGLIDKRYANQDAAGRTKESKFTGREEIAADEIKTFLEHPIVGVGVGMDVETRFERTGELVLSHSEITRMLSEHGMLGIIALIILFFTPLFLYLDNKHNIYLACFIVFWILTINHAAMRLAMPAFIYSLSLLKVYLPDEKTPIHRK